MASIDVDYIAAGGNRHPSAADWDSSGILAFGSDRNVALWRPLSQIYPGVHALLTGHNDIVNVVKWITYRHVLERGSAPHASTNGSSMETTAENLAASLLLSGSGDSTIRIWAPDGQSPTGYKQVQVLYEHQKSINAIAVLADLSLFASGSADATVKLWDIKSSSRDHIEAKLLQNISLTPKMFPMALALSHIESASVILAVAGTKPFIQIFVSQVSTQQDFATQFRLVATLSGHEGWIRSLTFKTQVFKGKEDLLLASASQDKYIRLWRVHPGEELPMLSAQDQTTASIGSALSNKTHCFHANNTNYAITFEALLLGHEDWIFTVHWHPLQDQIKLLSASADNSLAIWEPDPISGVWVCTVRLGDISAQKGATTATGSTGGFWIGLWSPGGDAVVSLGRTGSWRLWKYRQQDDRWEQDVAISGHTKEVQALAWAPDGSYLLSTGFDQTTRLFAAWRTTEHASWHEFSRPQIHGYDLQCLDTLSSNQFISGADEKLLRVFNEPRGVANWLLNACRIATTDSTTLPEAANIPVLGLSNKAIDAVGTGDHSVKVVEGKQTKYDSGDESSSETARPPIEDRLARHLLWPETEKLYGHGYEISAVASSHDGTLVATSCRASAIDHAVIRIYETRSWREIKPSLAVHSLTVTSLKFSIDDRYLLSVGRDRQFAVFERNKDNQSQYNLLISNPKAHTRMILDAAWAPNGAGRVFATAGRDKNVHFWSLEGDSFKRRVSVAAPHPVTAVAILQEITAMSLIIFAFGTENGMLAVCHTSIHDIMAGSKIETIFVDQRIIPSRLITALAWRPSRGSSADEPCKVYQLAVASEDSSLRIYNISILC